MIQIEVGWLIVIALVALPVACVLAVSAVAEWVMRRALRRRRRELERIAFAYYGVVAKQGETLEQLRERCRETLRRL